MIICENEPAELPKDVVRSETKVDDGIQQLNLNLNNILEKFERGTASNEEESQPTSAGTMIDKPSFNIKKTLMAFESKLGPENESSDEPKRAVERPVVRKLANLDNFFKNSCEDREEQAPVKPLVVRRSESLMNRLKKYESRIAGEQVDEDDDDEEEQGDDNNNNKHNVDKGDVTNQFQAEKKEKKRAIGQAKSLMTNGEGETKHIVFPKRLSLSSLKSQWENGDISSRRDDDDEKEDANLNDSDVINGEAKCNGRSPLAEKNEELNRIRQQLARRKSGEKTSIKNIYENAIKEAQQQQLAIKRNSDDLSALNGFSTSSIQKQLLQNNSENQESGTPNTSGPYKSQFQLNLNNRANKLKEKFELGLINNTSHDDSDVSDGEESPAVSKMEQLRQEKLEDLSIFTEGEIKAREARSMFQQIDRRLSSSSLSSINNKATGKSIVASRYRSSVDSQNNSHNSSPIANSTTSNQPIRLKNNIRT